VEVPKTRYARTGDGVHIAYQVCGSGPLDVVFVPGFASHVEFQWEEPRQARFFERLASFARLIRFDKRGTGLSDPVKAMPTLEERMDDMTAVMDAVGSERAAFLGLSEGGPLAAVVAASRPEQVSALIIWNAFARMMTAEDYPLGMVPEAFGQFIDLMEAEWGSGIFVNLWVPTLATDPAFRAWWTRFERLALSPGAAVELMRIYSETDVRAVLPMIRQPTLVLQSPGDPVMPTNQGRYFAENIAGARYLELPAYDHFSWVDGDLITGEIEEFLTGSRHPPEADRVLATVLFTDIVDSTRRAADLGDRRWHDLLDRHDGLVDGALARYRGQKVNPTGDGMLAVFDGPARAAHCATAIRDGVAALGLEVRAGLHTGEIQLRGADVGGIAVHIGARVAALARPGEVLVSRTVTDLVAGSGILFANRGEHELKGVPGTWELFSVEV
jgi:class 3 adenylate cyclase